MPAMTRAEKFDAFAAALRRGERPPMDDIAPVSACPCATECRHECAKSWPNDEYGRPAPHGEGCICACPCKPVCTCTGGNDIVKARLERAIRRGGENRWTMARMRRARGAI